MTGRLRERNLCQKESADQTARAAIVMPVQPHFRTGIWLYWRDPPPVQSDQLIATGAEYPCPPLYITYYFMGSTHRRYMYIDYLNVSTELVFLRRVGVLPADWKGVRLRRMVWFKDWTRLDRPGRPGGRLPFRVSTPTHTPEVTQYKMKKYLINRAGHLAL